MGTFQIHSVTKTTISTAKINTSLFLSTNVYAINEPSSILMIKKEVEIKDKNLIKIKLRRNQISTTSEKYLFRVGNFESGSPEEILQLLINFDKAMVGTRTSSNVRNIVFLRTLLQSEALLEYDLIVVTFQITTMTHLQDIRKGLLKYFFLRNSLAKYKRVVRRKMCNTRRVKLRQFAAKL